MAADQPQEPRQVGEDAPRAMGEQTVIDYWFDFIEKNGQKTVVTYAYGLEIDRRSDAPGSPKSWTDLMTESLPAIQSDVDTYGLAA
jgi:hypothetical protein